jgi:hypothetical protein
MPDPTIPTCSDCEVQVPDPAERYLTHKWGIRPPAFDAFAGNPSMPDPTGADRQRRYRARQAGLLPPAELRPCACCPRQHTGTHGDHCWECWRLHTEAGRADRAARVTRSRQRRRREQEQVS